jgi:hypothetical protein
MHVPSHLGHPIYHASSCRHHNALKTIDYECVAFFNAANVQLEQQDAWLVGSPKEMH